MARRVRAAAPWVGAVVTGLLLAAAFAPLEWDDAAWICLVPLLLAARAVSPRRAIVLGFVGGSVFWLFSVAWLTHVTVIGWIALSLLCGLFLAPFAWFVSSAIRAMGTHVWFRNAGLMLSASAVWVGLEYTRSHLFTGFPWNQLGVSQYRHLVMIQHASWGGVYAVSALIVFLNVAIALTILRYADVRGRWGRRPHPELMLGLLVVALGFGLGWRLFQNTAPANGTLRVALIQPNIGQPDKWNPEKTDLVYRRLWELTDAAQRAGKVDLVVWPETAVPDDVRYSERSLGLVKALAANGTPILVGTMDVEWMGNQPVYYNSSFLFDTEGTIVGGYDKCHLVVFGEYIPFAEALPFVKAMTPIEASFSAGSTSTVFRVGSPPAAFSVLICFEDTVAGLARRSVRNGARLLINQTNDAWFEQSSAARQHRAHCVFRCVENRVAAIRATNSGVTCRMTRRGRITDELVDADGRPFIKGFMTTEVDVAPDDLALTFYTRRGDVFAVVSTALGGLLLAFTGVRLRGKGC